MTSAHTAGATYSGDSWEVLVLVDKHVPSLLEKAEAGTSMLDANSVQTVKCDGSGNRHFEYEECPCMDDA